MITYKVTNTTTNISKTDLTSRDIQLLLGISSSHVGFYASRGNFYKGIYKIEKIAETEIDPKKAPPGFKEEWDDARRSINPEAEGLDV